ncbi:MAG TPA: enoyl-CoA hydratase-related protein [Steroidobacteraceae bacterium]|nr:enoyl-CoA hydratase-related protein [Steroidobacteraceae bacterium]
MNDASTLAIRRAGAVLHVALNRPELRNAMSLAMVRELTTTLHAAESDGETRVIVLRGAGGHFCAGADLKDMAGARARLTQDPDAILKVNAAFGALCNAYAASGLAIVAVLEGAVMGGGFGLTCVADVVIAGDSTVFRLPETSLGVLPAQIAPFLVERLGYSEAKRLAVTGSRLDAREALAIRLVHEVHAAQDLDAALARQLQDILACAPQALAATKALLRRARWTPGADLVQEAAAAFSRAALGPEGTEGTTAFLQKRKPNWAPQ